MLPELLIVPVNVPVDGFAREPSTRVRSKRIPSPAKASPAPAVPRPRIVPVLLISKSLPASSSSAEKPAP